MGHVASGCYPTEPCAVCPGLPPGHSFRRILRRFQQPEEGSCRLPFGTGRSRFGTVSHTTYRQALTGLSWLSYSRPRFSGVPDSGQRIGSACRQVGGSPRRPRLNEPDGTSTRVAASNGFGPNPLGGICTLLDHHCLAFTRLFLVAPLSFEGKNASDRTSGLLCSGNGFWPTTPAVVPRDRITPMSLRRTGQARLRASGSTRSASCGG